MSLTVDDLWLELGGRSILRGAGFEVAGPVGLVTVSGPSGSGKTLLLELIGGFRRPGSGTVMVDDVVASSKDFTWVPQRPILFPELSVYDNVALANRFERGGRPDPLDALDAVGLRDRAADRAGRLSGGEVQRVCLARSAVARSPVVLADEPTGQLDAAATEMVTAALVALAGRKLVVVVTHDPDVAAVGAPALRLSAGTLVSVPAVGV